MRAEVNPRLIVVTLSQRNILQLIYKFRHQACTKALISGNIYLDGQAVDGLGLIIAVEPDASHYGDREPGQFNRATEAFIDDQWELLDPDRHRIEALIELQIGPEARIISSSKSGFRSAFPTEVAVFNANVFSQAPGGKPIKVWHGDLNLTREESALVAIAEATGETIWVLFEQDGRFRGREEEPVLSRAVLRVSGDGTVVFDESEFVRADDQTLRVRDAWEQAGDEGEADVGSGGASGAAESEEVGE